MDRESLIRALSTGLPGSLARDLVDAFVEIRQDAATCTLGRLAPGKFIESYCQVLQHLALGRYDIRPNVDGVLRTIAGSAPNIDEGLRICGARIARAMYSLRNKRSIAHKGEVDPNIYDLRFLLSGSQWILAELIRVLGSIPMAEAGKLVEGITAPVGGILEDFGSKRLVYGTLSVREEILVLLHSHYPDQLLLAQLYENLDRRSAGTVRSEVRKMWREKLVEGNGSIGYRLTKPGLAKAIAAIRANLPD